MTSPDHKRSAGLLIHISSLPSSYGIGDLGPEAYNFADFLCRTHQTYWQILPLTPVQEAQGFSPYSSISSLAGNTLLISPELLAEKNFLKLSDIEHLRRPVTDKIDFIAAARIKGHIFDLAYENSKSISDDGFEMFCNREAYWLDDYALFLAIKDHFGGTPWYEWPTEFKDRNLSTLLEFAAAHNDRLTKSKWLQFVFYEQWKSLRQYCNKLNVKIVGDLPFYMSYDSADIWTKKEIFDLKDDGRMKGVAGVPPDYFNKNGQLWGMPLYKWDVLKSQRYDWWLQRIRKNLELVDMLRLDHFRAFDSYWDVPGGRKTAAKGKWKPGPANELFEVIKTEFPQMPFIAEDLGDITPEVYDLRDRFGLPGMKVLQFAFGDAIASSPHAPHNYTPNFFAYTGTHDNNTSRGWFETELREQTKMQLAKYTGCHVNEKNAHHVLSRLAYSSVADTVIVPVQDVLGLDKEARMNTPASTSGNWQWRLVDDELDQRSEDWLIESMRLFGRSNPACSNSM